MPAPLSADMGRFLVKAEQQNEAFFEAMPGLLLDQQADAFFAYSETKTLRRAALVSMILTSRTPSTVQLMSSPMPTEMPLVMQASHSGAEEDGSGKRTAISMPMMTALKSTGGSEAARARPLKRRSRSL